MLFLKFLYVTFPFPFLSQHYDLSTFVGDADIPVCVSTRNMYDKNQDDFYKQTDGCVSGNSSVPLIPSRE